MGEDGVDAAAAARLRPLAQDDWLLAHAVHVDPPLRGTVAHNPRSNQNNAVGYARPARWAAAGNRVVLGTDGIGASMLDEFALAYVAQRADDVTATPEAAWSWLAAGADLVPEVLGDEVTWSADRADPWYLAFTHRRAGHAGGRRRRGGGRRRAAAPGSTASASAPGRGRKRAACGRACDKSSASG